MPHQPPVLFRPYQSSDLAFVASSWLLSYRSSQPTKYIGNDDYYATLHPLVEALARGVRGTGTATTLLAVNPEDSDQIYGWVSYGHLGPVPVLHYVYVKELFRRQKIATQLLDQAGFTHGSAFFYTFLPRGAEHLRPLYPAAAYNPFLLFQVKTEWQPQANELSPP